MRWAIVLALMLVALLSLTDTWALQGATMSSQQTIQVVSTDQALLTLAPGTGAGNAAGVAKLDSGNLVLELWRGAVTGERYGFGRNVVTHRDEFRFPGVFNVTNRSQQTQCISARVVGPGAAPDLKAIYARLVNGSRPGIEIAGSGGIAADPNVSCFVLGAGQTMEVDFWWEIVSTQEGSSSFYVRVEGNRR